MATFDQLSAEQRAIIELVLQRGKRYDELAGLLTIPETRVRELARDALVALSPVTARGVDDEWRGQIADYVLGQQSGPESTATRGHLRRSEPARIWASSLLDSLDTLYAGDGMPQIPEGTRAGRDRRPRGRRLLREREERKPEEREPEEREAEEREPRRGLSPAARAAVKRRRLSATGAGVVALIGIVLFVWPGVLGGDDDGDGGEQASAGQQGAREGMPAGIAIVAQRGGTRQLIVQAASLPPNRRREAYEVWLYNSPQDARSLGAQVTDQRGTYQGAGQLPDDFQRFRFVDVSREPIDQNRAHSGQSVLRGRITRLREPPANARRGQAVILGQIVLTPPR